MVEEDLELYDIYDEDSDDDDDDDEDDEVARAPAPPAKTPALAPAPAPSSKRFNRPREDESVTRRHAGNML